MKFPKTQRKYCPYCKKHTEQKVSIFKAKSRPKTKKRSLKWGVRHYAEIMSGYGGTTRIVVSPVKTSKKVALRFECTVCKKKYFKQHPKRAGKVEQV